MGKVIEILELSCITLLLLYILTWGVLPIAILFLGNYYFSFVLEVDENIWYGIYTVLNVLTVCIAVRGSK